MSYALADAPAPADLEDRILALKKKLNAVILAHYYQEGEIQDVADFVGDSLELAQQAAKTTGRRDRLLRRPLHGRDGEDPEPRASRCCCRTSRPAARWPTAARPTRSRPSRRSTRTRFVVTYVNSSAAVKAMCDVICTSSNAVKIVDRSARRTGRSSSRPTSTWAATCTKQTGREMILWPGSCMVHEIFSEKQLVQLKVEHPDAEVVAHPECEERGAAPRRLHRLDQGLLEHAVQSPKQQFIVVTEAGILHQMQKQAPGRRRSSPRRRTTAAPATSART